MEKKKPNLLIYIILKKINPIYLTHLINCGFQFPILNYNTKRDYGLNYNTKRVKKKIKSLIVSEWRDHY